MVDKENLSPGAPFEPLFKGIRKQEIVALLADTLLFLLVGALAFWVILALTLDFRKSTTFVALVGVIVLIAVLFGLYEAARKSIRHIKSHVRKPENE